MRLCGRDRERAPGHTTRTTATAARYNAALWPRSRAHPPSNHTVLKVRVLHFHLGVNNESNRASQAKFVWSEWVGSSKHATDPGTNYSNTTSHKTLGFTGDVSAAAAADVEGFMACMAFIARAGDEAAVDILANASTDRIASV